MKCPQSSTPVQNTEDSFPNYPVLVIRMMFATRINLTRMVGNKSEMVVFR